MTDRDEQTGQITSSLICVGCRYELVGLQHDGVCPECGASVDSSVRRLRLRTSDAAFARRIEAGVRMLLTSSLFSCVIVVVTVMGKIAETLFVAMVFGAILTVAGFCGAWFCWIVGWWLLASEDRSIPARSSWTCRLIKVCCGAQVASLAIGILPAVGCMTSSGEDYFAIAVGIFALTAAASAVCGVAGLGRLGQILRLLVAPGVEEAVTTMRVVLLIVYGGIIISGLVCMLSPTIGGMIILGFLTLLSIANLLWPFLVFSLWRAIRPEVPGKRVSV